jgi:hypothetical protein
VRDPLVVGLSPVMPEVASGVIAIRMCQPGAELATDLGAVLLIRTVERRAGQKGVAQRRVAQQGIAQ